MYAMYYIGQYTFLQWAVIFIAYCIFGWFFESAYCSLKSGHLQNRGFCHGPWIPIYGSGATLLVLLAGPFRTNHLAVFLIGAFGGSALELLTGWTMEKLFGMRWWDYSQNAFNFHGYICLYASLSWGFLALLIMDYVHPVVESISQNWSYLTFFVINTMLYTLFIEDIILSAISAMDLKKRLQSLAENSEEIQRLRSSIQDAYSRLEDAKREIDAGFEAMQDVRKNEGNVAVAKAAVKETLRAVRSGASAAEERIRGMERRLNVLLDGGDDNVGYMSWWTKTMLRNNPDAVSKNPGFGLLKAAALRRQGKKKKSEENEKNAK